MSVFQRMMRQRREVYAYVTIRAFHNALPFFALIVGIAGHTLAALAIVGVQIMTGAVVDLSFFFALSTEVKNGRGAG